MNDDIRIAIYFSMLLNATSTNNRTKWETAVRSGQVTGSAYDLLQVAQAMAKFQDDNTFGIVGEI